MTDRGDEQDPEGVEARNDLPRPKRTYVSPQLIVYGNVAKLTQTGGISVKDMGSMKQANT